MARAPDDADATRLSHFRIGGVFRCGGRRWRCTDIGTRVVIAIDLDQHDDDPSWFNGPPYAVVETVFDEYDLPACVPVTEPNDVDKADHS